MLRLIYDAQTKETSFIEEPDVEYLTDTNISVEQRLESVEETVNDLEEVLLAIVEG